MIKNVLICIKCYNYVYLSIKNFQYIIIFVLHTQKELTLNLSIVVKLQLTILKIFDHINLTVTLCIIDVYRI